jgi:tetratricopeptide (TPR) repeat protein
MSEPAAPQFLDVPLLIDRSMPRRAPIRMWQVTGIFMMVVLFSAYITSQGGQAAAVMSAVSLFLMVGLIAALVAISWTIVRKARAEQAQVEAIDELIRLRRWPEAAAMLEQLLGQPTRTPQARAHGLIFLASVLARYNRFEEAIGVQNYLLENIQLDGGTIHTLRLARAMAMLREDHLFDADRAINELRRQVSRAGRAMSQAGANAAPDDDAQEPAQREYVEPEPPQSLSAGLALIELYRDVKTGHPAEAIELFTSTIPSMRDQLGHRVADAHVLVARAYDLLGREAEAQAEYERATLLAPPAELHRRYPETAPLAEKYQPAIAPREAA